MNYVLFILCVSGITMFISESNLGIFIRKHPLLKEKQTDIPLNFKEAIYDLLHCSLCTSAWVSVGISILFEYYNLKMILLSTIFGPTIYMFIGSICSFIICSIAVHIGNISHH